MESVRDEQPVDNDLIWHMLTAFDTLNSVRLLHFESTNPSEIRMEELKFEYRVWVIKQKFSFSTFQLTSLVYGKTKFPDPVGHPKLRKQRSFDSWEACQENALAGDLIFLHDPGLYNATINCNFLAPLRECVVTKPVFIISTHRNVGNFTCDLEGGSEQWKTSCPSLGIIFVEYTHLF